jgi:hypothetical protein
MPRTTDDAIGPDRYSLDELRAAALRGDGELSRPLALALLSRVDYAQKVRDMTRLLMNDTEAPRLRGMAATALGQVGTRAAVNALHRALAITDDIALRGVLQGLSLSGNQASSEAVRTLSRRRGLVGEAVRNTGVLLRHRLGAAGAGAAVPPGTLRVSTKNAQPITVRAATPARATQAVEYVHREVPALRLTPSGALALRCIDRDLLFVFTDDVAKGGVARIAATKAEAGVVVLRRVLEGSGWEVKHHVLTEPKEDGSIGITVTSARGRPLYAGAAVIDGEQATFVLRALDTRGVAAIDIRGRYAQGRLRISEARTDLRVRRKAATPAPLRREP